MTTTPRRALAAATAAVLGLPLVTLTSSAHADSATLTYDCTGPAGSGELDVALDFSIDPDTLTAGHEAELHLDVDGSDFDLGHTPQWYLRVVSAEVETEVQVQPDVGAVTMAASPSLFDDIWNLTPPEELTVPETDELAIYPGDLVITQTLVEDDTTQGSDPETTPSELDEGQRTAETTCTAPQDTAAVAVWPVTTDPDPDPTPSPTPTPSPSDPPSSSPTPSPSEEAPPTEPDPDEQDSPVPDKPTDSSTAGEGMLPVSGSALIGLIIAALTVIFGGAGALLLAKRGRGSDDTDQ